MARINSKNKGSRFERTICKWFQDWTGYEFNRVPASGGLRWKKQIILQVILLVLTQNIQKGLNYQ